MKRVIFLVLISIVLSCSEKVIEKPENLIAKDQMVEIIYDLAIFNAAKKANASYLSNRKLEAMSFIYKKHGIDSIQFVKSDIYYASIPSEYEAMYKIVEARLEKEKSEMDKYKTRTSDSIRKIAEEQRERLRQDAAKKKEQDSIL
ncbi:MAG: DUF4296 domain-containing protein [Flavobacteriaceae bacterium]